MKQENMKQDLEQRTGYEAPALTVVNFRTEKGFAASSIQQPNPWEEQEW